MAQMAFTMVLLSVAAGVALLLGSGGRVRGDVVRVALRTREIGVRLALGAVPAGVAGMMAKQGRSSRWPVWASASLGRWPVDGCWIRCCYGVRPNDAGVLTTTTVVVLAVALGACWLPARRASKLEPVEALRSE